MQRGCWFTSCRAQARRVCWGLAMFVEMGIDGLLWFSVCGGVYGGELWDSVMGSVLIGEDGGVVSWDECSDDSDGLERVISFQMLITGGVEDEEVSETGCHLRSFACFLNLLAVFSISESTGNGVPVRKDLGINN